MKKLIVVFFSSIFYMQLLAQEPQTVNAKKFYSLIQKHPSALVLDVRPSEKFVQYHIHNALPIPTKEQLINLAKDIPTQDTIFVYCEKELRSGPAVLLLDSIGIQHVYELKGGLISWRRNGLPLDEGGLK